MLGDTPGDRVQPVSEDRTKLAMPETEEAALANAYQMSKNLRVLESKMQAKRLDKALLAVGVVSVLRLIPGMGHELKIGLPACSLAVEDGLAFLQQRLEAKK